MTAWRLTRLREAWLSTIRKTTSPAPIKRATLSSVTYSGIDRKARASYSRASSRDFTSALLPRPEKAWRAALLRSNRSPSMRVSRARSPEYCR